MLKFFKRIASFYPEMILGPLFCFEDTENTGLLTFNSLKQKKVIFNFFVNRNWKNLTDSRKRAKILADNRKNHRHPIETLLQNLLYEAVNRVQALSYGNWKLKGVKCLAKILLFKVATKVETLSREHSILFPDLSSGYMREINIRGLALMYWTHAQ